MFYFSRFLSLGVRTRCLLPLNKRDKFKSCYLCLFYVQCSYGVKYGTQLNNKVKFAFDLGLNLYCFFINATEAKDAL